MSLLSQAFLLDKFGPRLNVDQLAAVLDRKRTTIYNQVSAGTFEVPTYLDGNKRYADYRDVATYLDACRERATTQA